MPTDVQGYTSKQPQYQIHANPGRSPRFLQIFVFDDGVDAPRKRNGVIPAQKCCKDCG
ncbi:hypothetical protein CERSUDRAFT_100165 [Gelatoporia subvermispora B]|uniref:Uncharacterized protein n=1 Tax=Ceriporiopsis subvermispora (strain B) TaxID=914234 RepID=M2P8I0_CERS8|nr:hypothetical protein CERSUDRAFT_100165 [Gelatoporia subvermispora B]